MLIAKSSWMLTTNCLLHWFGSLRSWNTSILDVFFANLRWGQSICIRLENLTHTTSIIFFVLLTVFNDSYLNFTIERLLIDCWNYIIMLTTSRRWARNAWRNLTIHIELLITHRIHIMLHLQAWWCQLDMYHRLLIYSLVLHQLCRQILVLKRWWQSGQYFLIILTNRSLCLIHRLFYNRDHFIILFLWNVLLLESLKRVQI